MRTSFLLLMTLFLFTGCNPAPKTIVSEYLKAIDSFDFEKANTYLVQNNENREALNNMKKYAGSLDEAQKQKMIDQGENRKYIINQEKITEHSASIIASNDEGFIRSVISFKLKKNDGKWMIESFKAEY